MAALSRERLLPVLAPVVTAAGLDLEDIQVRPAGRRSLVRVVVDRDGGITLDDVAAVSRTVSDALDAVDSGGPYTLEVSSPGVQRPLTASRHWRRAIGRLVRVECADGEVLLGRVLAATADEATLRGPTGPRSVRYDAVTTAVVQVELTRPSADEADGDAGPAPYETDAAPQDTRDGEPAPHDVLPDDDRRLPWTSTSTR